ncbi:hypothetical protein [Streptomyces enissocaesilis]|uniref:Uncharacterized protein n=1 Tax=Streptomyces enissocaesilis TaxID=332589 RepID=A0ABP6JG80_9ACTN
MSGHEHIPPASNQLPIVTGTDGQAYIPADAVAAFLRAVAESCRNLADDPDCNLRTAGAAIDLEADALDCRAILRTT